MTSINVKSPMCRGIDVTKYGKSSSGKQRYYCDNKECKTKGFQLEYIYKAYERGIDKSIIAMTGNASGIRDISRVLEISTYKVMSTLNTVSNVNVEYISKLDNPDTIQYDVIKYEQIDEAELDEQWSFVQNKDNPRWL